jgi:16S rRNA (uracil1498-N3)-methyltransferase
MAHDLYYTPPSRIGTEELVIDGGELRHMVQVMRAREGDEILVTDGKGSRFRAVIRAIAGSTARCRILSRENDGGGAEVVLGVGILKNPARFDFLVEKVTELGVTRIVPLLTSRTVPRHAKEERWQRLALAAMKQSGRSVLPHVAPLTPFAEFLAQIPPHALRLLADPGTSRPGAQELLPGSGHSLLAFCIGPEGGFTPEEVSAASAAGFLAVSLGQARLRTETAAIAAAAYCALAGFPPASP